MQNFGGGNFGEFGKMIVIRQYFTQPNSRFTIVINGKFANVFRAKTLKRSIRHQSFTPQHIALYGTHYGKQCTLFGFELRWLHTY